MSMLGMQADELRKTADMAANLDDFERVSIPWMRNKLAPMLREAADTIISLRNRLDMTCKLEETEWVSMQCPMYRCSKCNGMFEDGRGDYRYCPYCGARVERRDA